MIYSSVQKMLTESSCEEFNINNTNVRISDYPFEQEENELLQYIREKYKQRFGQIHELEK